MDLEDKDKQSLDVEEIERERRKQLPAGMEFKALSKNFFNFLLARSCKKL